MKEFKDSNIPNEIILEVHQDQSRASLIIGDQNSWWKNSNFDDNMPNETILELVLRQLDAERVEDLLLVPTMQISFSHSQSVHTDEKILIQGVQGVGKPVSESCWKFW